MKYFVKYDEEDDWMEVSKERFIRVEKLAGFYSKRGPDELATGGFSGKGLKGKVDYESGEEW